MSKPMGEQRGTPLNHLNDGDVFAMMLEAMSVQELTDALDAAVGTMTEDDYDPALIDAYLDALDRKDPIPEIPDKKTSYAAFQRKLHQFLPKRRRRTVRRAWRTALAAAITVICMMGTLVVAQAAGWDVLGTFAQWTDEVFSFSEVRSDGAVDVPKFASLQAALDAYGITEVSEPTWIPEGYVFKDVVVDCWPEYDILGLSAEYWNGNNLLIVKFESYQDKPTSQIEKTDAPVETFVVNNTMVYLLENTKNNAAAWLTEHYECLIAGAVTKSELKQMVLSIFQGT